MMSKCCFGFSFLLSAAAAAAAAKTILNSRLSEYNLHQQSGIGLENRKIPTNQRLVAKPLFTIHYR